MATDREEIESAVKAAIASALNRELPEITNDTTLFGDLGVQSLDLVEIVYEIEETYDIEIEPDNLAPHRLLRDPRFVENGRLTEAGYAQLQEQFSFTTLPNLPPDTPADEVANRLLTFGGLVDYVQSLLEREET